MIILAYICSVLATIFGILWGKFRHLDSLQTQDNEENIRHRYYEILICIEKTGFWQLPENVIRWYLGYTKRVQYVRDKVRRFRYCHRRLYLSFSF
jgi:hypothetical protein